jgi:Zinc finger, C3HC4 type (RING finger)
MKRSLTERTPNFYQREVYLVMHATTFSSSNLYLQKQHAENMSSKSSEHGQHCGGPRHIADACQDGTSDVDQYAKSTNISGRRLLIRAIRESLHSMEQREASKVDGWTEEITKLRLVKKSASNVVINSEEVQQRRCVICHDKEKSVILMPCRHLCLCIECSNNISVETCPKCRAIICSKIHVFT